MDMDDGGFYRRETKEDRYRDVQECFTCGEEASTTHEGQPICDDCLDHFLGKSSRNSRRMDYTDSATANDMRFGSDSDTWGDF